MFNKVENNHLRVCRLRVVNDSGPLSQKSAGHMQNRKTKTNTNPSPDPSRYRRRCPDPNARIQKFIHYMAIATFAIAARFAIADCHLANKPSIEYPNIQHRGIRSKALSRLTVDSNHNSRWLERTQSQREYKPPPRLTTENADISSYQGRNCGLQSGVPIQKENIINMRRSLVKRGEENWEKVSSPIQLWVWE